MLLPMKVLAPANAVEHMVDWSMATLSLGKQDDGYGIAVTILISPELREALAADTLSVKDAEDIARVMVENARRAVEGFLNGC